MSNVKFMSDSFFPSWDPLKHWLTTMIAVDLDVVSVSVVLIAKIPTLQIRVNFMQVSCCFFVSLMSAFAL